MTTFECVNPPMMKHAASAMIAGKLSGHAGMPEIPHNSALSWFSGNFSRILKWTENIVLRMIAIFEPLSCLNDDWFLAVFHAAFPKSG